ncbi:MAG: hypothetical protein ACE5IQ_03945 [Candidatus Methylomirabilales bacterium]
MRLDGSQEESESRRQEEGSEEGHEEEKEIAVLPGWGFSPQPELYGIIRVKGGTVIENHQSACTAG